MKDLLYVSNLNIGLTQKCNLACGHCFCGDPKDVTISKDTLTKIFEEVKIVHELYLMGGEIMLVPDVLGDLAEVLKTQKVVVDNFKIFTNGTLYNEEYFNKLKELSALCRDDDAGNVLVSYDRFHRDAAAKYMDLDKYKENILKLNSQPLVRDFTMDCDILLVKQGNACNLSTDVPLFDHEVFSKKTAYLDLGERRGNKWGLVSDVTINSLGEITDEMEFAKQKDNFHGSIYDRKIKDIVLDSPATQICANVDECNRLVSVGNARVDMQYHAARLKRLNIKSSPHELFGALENLL